MTTKCTVCGEEVRPQQYHEPYVCRACRAGIAMGNEIDAARRRGASFDYVRGILVSQGLLLRPELVEELGF